MSVSTRMDWGELRTGQVPVLPLRSAGSAATTSVKRRVV